MNIADREPLIDLLTRHLDDATAEDTADAILDAGFIGPAETAELHHAVAALQATIASLRAAEQERLQHQATVTQVQSSTAGAIAVNRLGSTA